MIVFDILERAISRLRYETKRVRKVGPTLIRLSISELGDLYHRFNHWRGACDHDLAAGKRRSRKGSVARPAARRKRPKSRA